MVTESRVNDNNEKIEENDGRVMTLFPTPCVVVNIGREFTKKELQLFLTDIPMKEDIEKGALNHRSKDYYLFDNFADKGLKDIKVFCEQNLKQYMEDIEGVDTDKVMLRVTQSWLNKTKPGESHHQHTHPNSYLSGVLYISCLPNDHVEFNDRLHGIYNNMQFSVKKTTIWNAQGVRQDIKDGDLIMFPSWVPHHVDVNKTNNNERISLSFNTFPTGEIGNYDDISHLKLS